MVTRLHKGLRGAGLLACAAVLLAGCSGARSLTGVSRPVFDGQYFRADIAADPADPAPFTVSVRDAGKSLRGAREAGRYFGGEHCVKYFGSSRIDWTAGPDAPAEALRFDDGDLVLSGVCRGW